MQFNGAIGATEVSGNNLIALPFGQQSKDLCFSWGQAFKWVFLVGCSDGMPLYYFCQGGREGGRHDCFPIDDIAQGHYQ